MRSSYQVHPHLRRLAICLYAAILYSQIILFLNNLAHIDPSKLFFSTLAQRTPACLTKRELNVLYYEQIFAATWRRRLEQLEQAENDICAGVTLPNRSIDELVASLRKELDG